MENEYHDAHEKCFEINDRVVEAFTQRHAGTDIEHTSQRILDYLDQYASVNRLRPSTNELLRWMNYEGTRSPVIDDDVRS